jgi:hypothetical protein
MSSLLAVEEFRQLNSTVKRVMVEISIADIEVDGSRSTFLLSHVAMLM